MSIFSIISISGLIGAVFFLLIFFSGALGLNFKLHQALAYTCLLLVLIHGGVIAYKNYKIRNTRGKKV